uniref:Myosin-A-like n=1 Tax=Dermatophagoides pteronyssinus TaxID=6956 RepID=A0A6P6Y4D3_DERPT|nr:myosin-A-like [Dermatophagoides pteronyssinus]
MPAGGPKLKRDNSELRALDKNGQVFKGFYVWCSQAPAVQEDPDLMFARCLVLPGSTNEHFKLRQVEPEDLNGATFESDAEHVYNCNAGIDPLSYPDIGMLPHTNNASVIDFIRQRYLKGQIYVNAEPLLLSVNPFKELNNTTQQIIDQYIAANDIGQLPPHVFTIARRAFDSLHGINKSQTIIVSGESGAGKTEAAKQVMKYFATSSSGRRNSLVQDAVLAGNPVLEAFGNAKTLRNDNSSRFGRFMQMEIGKNGGIESGLVRCFLLEKSRIISQSAGERSYHIFYQMLSGLSAEEKKKYGIQTHYNYLKAGALKVPSIDDKADFQEVRNSLKVMGVTDAEFDGIMKCLSAVLLMGNVEIVAERREGLPNAAAIKQLDNLHLLSNLIEIDSADLLNALTVKTFAAGGAGKTVKGVYTASEAVVVRDSMAKAMYQNLFNWIIAKLNKKIAPANGFRSFVAILDIFGFEVFDNNSLEQFFINITNEMLQKNFVDVVFEKETALYKEEGISQANLVWTSNDPIIELLTKKGGSIISYLEDACVAPASDDAKFVHSCHVGLGSNPNYSKPKVGSDCNFVITHTIGDIQYNAQAFLAKNRDILKNELVDVLKRSKLNLLKEAFDSVSVVSGKIGKDQLISSTFLKELKTLIGIINETETHFIRCLKPNEEKAALKYVPSKVLVQLYSLSILEALQLRNLGYSYRRLFEEFCAQFKFLGLGIAEDKTLTHREAATQLLKKSNVPPSDFQLGKTMVFLKNSALKDLNLRQRELLAVWSPLVSVLENMYKTYKFRRMVRLNTPGLVRLQAHIRSFNARNH